MPVVHNLNVLVVDDQPSMRGLTKVCLKRLGIDRITDAGTGFQTDAVEPGRLGFAESVVGRLHAVGGRARVFSSPGAGTTVMLEVPKP